MSKNNLRLGENRVSPKNSPMREKLPQWYYGCRLLSVFFEMPSIMNLASLVETGANVGVHLGQLGETPLENVADLARSK